MATDDDQIKVPLAHRVVNQRLKRDRLADAATLASARDRIVDWWVKGYREDSARPIAERFVREATATPGGGAARE